MTISISDPLTLFPYQAGLTDPPLVEAAAKAANDLATTQRAYKIGDPVPIIFCRRINGNGGVLVSPGATEGRWENDGTTNELTVSLMVVLSEGELATIPIKDCFVGPCRQGTWAQTYDRRAGSWTPGNYLTTVSGKQPWTAPYYCGTSGSYDNMTTLSCVNSYIDGSQRSGHQLHVFVRSGMEVTRIIDSTAGPSNNVVDLALYLMSASGRVPSGLIDTTQMLAAANFTDTNGLHFNGVYEESRNLDDWLEEISNDFLLRLTEKNGKFGFRSRLPVNVDHTINTGVIDWEFTFTEDHLLPDGFDIQYVPLTDRQPVCLQMMWRQQPESDIGFPRTTEIRFNGEATDGPFEQYDLSGFCTSENHAVKVGAFRLARRKLITHTLRLKVRPASYNSSLALGDIVRVRLRRETAVTGLDYHDYLYEVERIEKTASGACVFDLTHYPIDSQGRSLVALAVNAATGPGVTLDPGRDDYSCDDNSATDDTGLPDTGIDYPAFPETPTSTDTDVTLDQPGAESSPIGPAVTPTPGQPIGNADNPVDPLEQTLDEDGTGILSSDGDLNAPANGDTLEVTEADLGCDGQVCWKKVDKTTFEEFDISCQDQAISGAYTLSITTDEIDYYIVAVGRCKDPSTASGYGEPRTLGTTGPVSINPIPNEVGYWRWTGTVTNGQLVTGAASTGWIRNRYRTDNGVVTQVVPGYKTISDYTVTTTPTQSGQPTLGVPLNGSGSQTHTVACSGGDDSLAYVFLSTYTDGVLTNTYTSSSLFTSFRLIRNQTVCSSPIGDTASYSGVWQFSPTASADNITIETGESPDPVP